MEKIKPEEVCDWAKQFLSQCEKELTPDELKEQKKYATLFQKPLDKVLMLRILDESSQVRNDKKLASRIRYYVTDYGVPSFFNKSDTFLFKLFAWIGYIFYPVSIPIFKRRLRKDTEKVIIHEERPALTKHLASRKREKIGQNVNLLGEVVLGNAEADKRYHHYLEALKEPDINYISIKISGIYAQLHPLNYAGNKEELCKRLTTIYQHAIDNPVTNENGEKKPKFVNLDMEEYKDMELTYDVFTSVLSMPQFKHYNAGIVVQAYLPDSWHLQTRLLDFAKKRVAEGGAPLKMRLVKGANQQMETVISSLKGWENPVLPSKVEVDANYMHLVDRALEPENIKALHVGIASHNFFTIGYAYLLSQKNGVEDYVSFEMLEGMANHLPRVMKKRGKQVILYTPVVKNEHFLNAVSYLVRRLDENTGKDNFLSYAFNLKADSEQWDFLSNQFMEAFAMKDKIDPSPNRKQNRNEKRMAESDQDILTFKNEPDTDFDLEANKKWAEKIRDTWRHKARPEQELSGLEQVKQMLKIAEEDTIQWRNTTVDERHVLLHKVAENLADSRGDLIGCMTATTGKTFMEGDVEVSEAIDFCRFYPITMKKLEELETISCSPKGVVLVISPWNFPLAIPVGGVAAALAGGNSVILKPATVAFPIAQLFARCFWDAGIPKEALQIVCCANHESLDYLTSSPVLKHIILTGGTDTAFKLLENNPTCPLSAETGGKNAIILTELGDRDHAIQNVVQSAFSNAGQKCSACSLLLIEKGIYNDPEFKSKLRDAVTSIQTGSPWELKNIVGPMITNKNDKLLYAIEHLEAGESWLVEPEFLDEEKFILKPCVKWGVKPGSYTFTTELFAPLLAVVCIENLEEGIAFVSSSEYGLTSGLQSLDDDEQLMWKASIDAGNLYINRSITGAIVKRQPFGGMKRSAFGGGIKAGSPNYVSCFVSIKENELYNFPPSINGGSSYDSFEELLIGEDKNRFTYAIDNYIDIWNSDHQDKNKSDLYGERNILRYRYLKTCALRICPEDDLCDILLIMAASTMVNTTTVSISPANPHIEVLSNLIKKLGGRKIVFIEENEESFLSRMNSYERIRTCSADIPNALYRKAAELGIHIANSKPLAEGKIELLNYAMEQTVSYEYHRYGNTNIADLDPFYSLCKMM